ncbi:MAG: amidohydrolase family protein [Actinobacteria bacterium]|nr:amidohydrolase family protein [Actinomycetota bacterium]
MRVIDVHTHCWIEELAPRVLEIYKSSYKGSQTPWYNGTTVDLIRSMDESGVEKSVVLPVSTKAKQVDVINTWLESYLRHDRLIPFATVHPETENPKEVIDSLAKRGFKGIKLHPLNQDFCPQEERMFHIYDAAIDNDMIIFFHAGTGLDLPAVRGSKKDFDAYFERYPYDKTVLAHLGGVPTLQDNPEVIHGRPGYIDLSYFINVIDDEVLVKVARAHGTKRVMFGTDGPWKSAKSDIEHLSTAGFTQEELEDILYNNAAKLLEL